MRQGLKLLIDSQPDLGVVGEGLMEMASSSKQKR